MKGATNIHFSQNLVQLLVILSSLEYSTRISLNASRKNLMLFSSSMPKLFISVKGFAGVFEEVVSSTCLCRNQGTKLIIFSDGISFFILLIISEFRQCSQCVGSSSDDEVRPLPDEGDDGIKRVKRAIKEPSKYTPMVIQSRKLVSIEIHLV